MKNNIYMVGWVLSLLADDCEISIFRGNTVLVEDTPKLEVSYKHYSRCYRRFFTNDGELLKDTKSVTIQVY